MYYEFKPYVRVADRIRAAQRETEKLRKKGQKVSPIVITGKKIATTFWGTAWCEHLERYSDFSNRLPRGRTYVRNGSVVDLQIAEGVVTAKVSGSSMYKVKISIAHLPSDRWRILRHECVGAIDSLVELLQGRFSKGVMERLCHPIAGLFPAPSEIRMDCSCPDWAGMCKHVAATLYGVGARLDNEPALLFKLRGVDETELIASATAGPSVGAKAKPRKADKTLASQDLSALFGIEMADGVDVDASAEKAVDSSVAAKAKARRAAKKKPKQPATKTVRPIATVQARAAMLSLQGEYLGVLRGLEKADRVACRDIARKVSVKAAVAFAKTRLNVAPTVRARKRRK